LTIKKGKELIFDSSKATLNHNPLKVLISDLDASNKLKYLVNGIDDQVS